MGIYLLVSCDANTNCHSKIVRFYFPGESVLRWKDNTVTLKGNLISYVRDQKLIAKYCIYYTVHVQDTNKQLMTLQSIPIVNEFSRVFPNDFP